MSPTTPGPHAGAEIDDTVDLPFEADKYVGTDDKIYESFDNTAGYTARDDYSSGDERSDSPAATYIYRDALGAPYLRVDRIPPRAGKRKQFPQARFEDGQWKWGKPPAIKIPYRLPELLAAPLSKPVCICEGEKDAENVAALGLVATTNSEGATKGKWAASLNKWFAGRTVVLLEDNDPDGRRHVDEVADHLRGIASEIRIVEFRDLPPGADVSDWLARGGTKEKLIERTKAARVPSHGYVLVRASDVLARNVDWLWDGYLPRNA